MSEPSERDRRLWWISDYVDNYKTLFGCADHERHDPDMAFDHDELTFDHVMGVKEGNVSDLLRGRWEVLFREIRKCEVVCDKHHRRRTRWRAPSKRDLATRRTSFMFEKSEWERLQERLRHGFLGNYRETKQAEDWCNDELRRILAQEAKLTPAEWAAVLEVQFKEGRPPTVSPSHVEKARTR